MCRYLCCSLDVFMHPARYIAIICASCQGVNFAEYSLLCPRIGDVFGGILPDHWQ